MAKQYKREKQRSVPKRLTVSLSSNPFDANDAVASDILSWGLGSSSVAISGKETVLSLLPVSRG